MQNVLARSGLQGNVGPTGKPTAPKPDINTVATDVFQLKKMFLHFMRVQGIELPPDILDGPNRDPLTGAPAASPSGGSDVQPGASAAGMGINGAPQSAIKPIAPMPGAFPTPTGGVPKTGAAVAAVGQVTDFKIMRSKWAAVARLCRERNRQGGQ
jgi:hypothetical protein